MSNKTSAITDTNLERERHELELAKFEFEKAKDKRNSELEQRKLRHGHLDSVLRVLLGILITAGVTGGVTLYGIRAEEQRTLRADENRRAEVLIQMINAREKAEKDLRAHMFDTLLEFYSKMPGRMSAVLLLELVGLNFRDTVQLKPVFETLDSELLQNDPQRLALRKAAGRIVRDQLDLVRQANDGDVCRLSLAVREIGIPECFPLLTIELLEAAKDRVRVRVNSKDGKILEGDNGGVGDEFTVTYFDMPMVDYTSVSAGALDNWRYSIVLEGINNEATLAVAVLPRDSYSPHHPYKFDELLARYLDPQTP